MEPEFPGPSADALHELTGGIQMALGPVGILLARARAGAKLREDSPEGEMLAEGRLGPAQGIDRPVPILVVEVGFGRGHVADRLDDPFALLPQKLDEPRAFRHPRHPPILVRRVEDRDVRG